MDYIISQNKSSRTNIRVVGNQWSVGKEAKTITCSLLPYIFQGIMDTIDKIEKYLHKERDVQQA